MAKVTFEFDYYEDANDIELHTKVGSLVAAIFDFKNNLRTKIKYGGPQDEKYDIYEKVKAVVDAQVHDNPEEYEIYEEVRDELVAIDTYEKLRDMFIDTLINYDVLTVIDR